MDKVKATINSFKDIVALVAEHELPVGGENEDGEFVMICQGRTEEGLGRSYQVETLQNNGWCRINTYWQDGTKDETYKRSVTEEITVPKHGLDEALSAWKDKVMATYHAKGGGADTLRMIRDVDKIIAEAFDHDPVL